MNAALVRLDSIAEVRLGRQRSPKDHEGPHMRPYVRAANVGWEGWKLDDVKYMNFTDAEMSVYRLRPGDLLLGEASGSATEVGKPAIWDGEIEECAFQNTLIRVRPREAQPRYLLHYFKFLAGTGKFAARSRGVGINHLGSETLASWEVPLPPIEEQRRIAAILDKADELRAKRRAALAHLDSLTQSIFLDMFGDHARFPSIRVGDLCDVKGGKRLPKDAAYSPASTGFRYLRVVDLRRDGTIDTEGLLHLPPDIQRRVARYTVAAGDVVISIAGSIGLVAAVDASVDGVNLTENAARLCPKSMGSYSPGYLSAALRSPVMQERIARSTGQVTIGKLALFRIEDLEVALPPMSLQLEFESEIRAVAALRANLGNQTMALESLFVSLQHRAFSGSL